ncbi:type B chloramphenicol O-acetyltransferase [Afifella pfennigii]|uniref:type B chloramphenicol O-acetyltransferase n=1 Tax=Afifella pfennigii TaxID=209897 RepID=UPI00047CF741|nr:type B chloramphenicol O-acetyltransferase [Afifella pfennigii]
MLNVFDSPFKGVPIAEQVRNRNIEVGRYSYYSGYYHGHPFEECVRYLAPDRDDVDRLIIGSFCSVGTGAVFMMAGNQGHRNDWISTFPFFYQAEAEPAFGGALDGFRRAGDTVIGHDVWIGAEAMVMPGICVGDGAIIASRAVVTRDVEPYTIVGGNPARPIRKRFAQEEIALLLQMRWWSWPLERIGEEMPGLCSGDVRGVHARWRRWREAVPGEAGEEG